VIGIALISFLVSKLSYQNALTNEIKDYFKQKQIIRLIITQIRPHVFIEITAGEHLLTKK